MDMKLEYKYYDLWFLFQVSYFIFVYQFYTMFVLL